MHPFVPLFRNSHLATIAGNFWARPQGPLPPAEEHWFEPEPGVKVLLRTQQPAGPSLGDIILLHGLEGSSEAGYMRSMAHAGIQAGYRMHRLNMRSCGLGAHTSRTMYHAGLTADLQFILNQWRASGCARIFVVGFSLGGNVVLKLAGELQERGPDLLAGVCAVSAPIDLSACVRQIERPANAVYQWRFVSRLKQRALQHRSILPPACNLDLVKRARTVYQFDDLVTAKAFGFGTADHYYASQSSAQFLNRIRVPTLLIVAKDDPMIPFSVYEQQAPQHNPQIKLLAIDHGGHLGFLARSGPRFWLDCTVLNWIDQVRLSQWDAKL